MEPITKPHMEPITKPNTKTWSCNVCSQAYQDIMILPCSHQFCERCLRVWVGVYVDSYRSGQQEFPCRLCWQFFHIPQEGGLDAYRHSYDVIDLGQQLNKMSMDTDDMALDNSNSRACAQPADVINSNAMDQYGFSSTSDLTKNIITDSPAATTTSHVGDLTSSEGYTQMGVSTSNRAPEFRHLPPSIDNQYGRNSDPACGVDNEFAMEEISCPENVRLQTNRESAPPLSFQDQNVYGQRLCFPSCHTYMHHLV